MKKLVISFAFLFVGVFAFSQVTTSNIKGLVLDETGQPLLGGNVLAIHLPTGTKDGASTNFDGRFNIVNMRVGGPYSITVSYVGYKDQIFNDVYLTLGKTFDLNVSLSTDVEQLDAVVITGTTQGTFGNDRTGAETSVGRRELTRLPTISRSAADFTRLEPTASGNSFGGRNDLYNNFSLDGAIFNNPFGLDAPTVGGQTDAQPISLDAIDQISVSTAPYDVTQSGFTGASVNAVTKSGTNEFHGTVYGFFRNEDLTGGKIKGEDVTKADLEQSQYGISIGGPIVKDKLFFFANFEKDERTDLGNSWSANNDDGILGINESRVLESDLIAVQEALWGVLQPDGTRTGGLGYNPGGYEGFTYASESTKGIVKLDWNINDNNRLAVIYNWLDASKGKPAHPTAIQPRGPNFTTLQFENTGYQINNKLQSVQLELNSQLADNVSNKLQAGYTHFDDFRNPLSVPAPSIVIQDGAGLNYIIAGHEPFSIVNTLDQKVFQFSNNMNIFKGDHTYTVGFSFEKFEFDNSFNLGAYGAAGVFFPQYGSVADFLTAAGSGALQQSFDDATAAHNALNAAGDGVAGGWALAETNVGQLAFYLQDEWNITEQFKLTYGVRFDKPLFFDSADKAQELIDRNCCVDPSIPYYNPNSGETVFIDNTKMPNNDWLISPRVGFNYDVKGDDTFQLRGGTGLFTGRFPFVWLGNQIANPNSFFLTAVDPDYKFPQVWRTNIGTDYKFESGLILTGDVSYTKDINGAHVQNWGLQDPTGTLNAPGDNRPIYTSADVGNNGYVFTNSDKGRIWNASLKAQKNFDNGLYTMLAYSYLNAKDVNSIEAEITGDAFDFNPTSGDANKDVLSYSKYGDTHRFIGVASKKWTYGNDKWSSTLSTFFEYAQGGRFNYTYAGNINNDSSFQNNDLIYIPTSSEVQQMMFSGGASMANDFESFIQQDDYLSDNRGNYAERYGAIAPWRGRWDLKFLQDYNFKVSEDKTNTIQLSLDILNVGNLISSDWGVVEQPNNLSPLGVDTSGSEPVYTFSGGSDAETFGFDASLASRWQAQFGVRYIF